MALNDPENLHASVLLPETINILDPKADEVFVDATLGIGGHTEALLNRERSLKIVGIDQDLDAIDNAKARLSGFGERFMAVHGNFSDIATILDDIGIKAVHGILADLGVSSLQFDSDTRGFSFRFDAPLDMRMDASSDTPTAAELLKELNEEEIANVIYQYGEERFSRRIARRIVERRKAGNPVCTTSELTQLVERSVPRRPKDKIHPATKTFQALRIAVNNELGILEGFLNDSVDLLTPDGRLAIIAFHSLEDRIVKQTFQKLSGKCQCPPRMPRCECGAVKKIEILTKKPMIPGDDEINRNPRSRSAKLRAVRKLA
jgi:16S rRNA (cytosine1402-N4)-methyltransferase